jgi:AcrR family transcriptional regulator
MSSRGQLPRGRHGLEASVVLESQQARIVAALSLALLECGYWNLRVLDITNRAGVSRATFYQHFEDKLDCLLRAHRTAFEELLPRVGSALARSDPPQDPIVAARDATLAFALEDLPRAVLLVLPPLGADPRLAQQALSYHRRFAETIAANAERRGLDPQPPQVGIALFGGLAGLLAAHLVEEELDLSHSADSLLRGTASASRVEIP